MVMKKGKSVSLVVIGLIASVFLLTACNMTKPEEVKIEDANKETIKRILELQFTGPDEKLMDLSWNPKYKVVEDGFEKNEELMKYINELYGEYFTENELDAFIRTGGSTYQNRAHFGGFELNFKDVTIEQHEKHKNRYTFIAQVGYQKDEEEEKIANVKGLVLFSTTEEGKVGRFQYGFDDGLAEENQE